MIFDSIKNAHIYASISPNLKTALDFMKDNDLASIDSGRYSLDKGNIVVIIKKDSMTKEEAQCKWESHLEYIDIQYLLDGREKIGYCSTAQMQEKIPYDAVADKIIYHNTDKGFTTRLGPGNFVILFPDDAHMTLISDGEPTVNSKAVIKVRI